MDSASLKWKIMESKHKWYKDESKHHGKDEVNTNGKDDKAWAK